ncbi:MAG: speD [Moraxellaceae bacterium]|jgi:S-adenosylmethionine decarboxylase|nr:speD [Moraxellaceae bacterium]
MKSASGAALGEHLLADLHGVTADRLTDAAFLERVLRDAALQAGAHILFGHFHSFGEQQGVTGVLLLQESHISIHTWPEHGYAAVDVFMCGQAEARRAVEGLCASLRPARHELHAQRRGLGLHPSALEALP